MLPVAMIVEDDEGLRMIYNHVLSKMGFDVIEVSDGQHAMEILQEVTPNILFLDVRLPFVNGIDILDFVRDTPRFDNTRVIVASSNTQPDTKISRPLVDFVLKPIHPTQIREFADSVL